MSWSDVDGDSIPDELDAPDATQSLDSDGDGFGDNPLAMPTNSLNDIDGDGRRSTDLFNDGTQWADSDGDGPHLDNPTQWLDVMIIWYRQIHGWQ